MKRKRDKMVDLEPTEKVLNLEFGYLHLSAFNSSRAMAN